VVAFQATNSAWPGLCLGQLRVCCGNKHNLRDHAPEVIERSITARGLSNSSAPVPADKIRHGARQGVARGHNSRSIAIGNEVARCYGIPPTLPLVRRGALL